MAKKKNINKIIRQFADSLKEEIRLHKLILFGSYAKGRQHKYSDIDIAVISSDFGKRNEMEEMTYLLKKAHEIDLDIEPHPYTPREMYKPHKSSFAYKILRTGKIVYLSKN